ncbi:MAG TPA: hypothetical protein VHI52_18840 [Verrucomicrobiae bacterium]|nr:hypothetical protein [Verrucomicrobiae bacterium]HWB08271.1 hypothetical protein [Pirellulales bacterium]
MGDRQASHRWGPAAAVLLLLLVALLYPLSLPPANLMYRSLGSPDWMDFLQVVYKPLDRLPEPFHSMLDRYVNLWPLP